MFQNYVVGALVAYAASAIDLANESLAQTDSTLETERTQWPKDNCCFLYPEQDYQGQMRIQCENDKDVQPWTIFQSYNYRYTNSYRCGKNAKLSTCDEDASEVECENYHNAYIAASSGAMSVRKFGSAMKNDIYSYKVEFYDPDTKGAATLFQGSDCAGYSSTFEYDPTNTRADLASEYLRNEMYEMGHMDGWARSLYVPYGYEVEMYHEDNFVGESWIVQGQPIQGQQKCISTDYPYSLKIRKLPKPGVATGQWVRFASENYGITPITFALSKTYSSGVTNSTKNTSGSTISGSAGFEFAGKPTPATETEKEKESTNKGKMEAAFEVKNETEALESAKSDASNTESKTKTVACPEDANIGGATIWQWTVTSPNGAETVNTLNFICRNDIDHRMKPACLPALCKNRECSECRDSTDQ